MVSWYLLLVIILLYSGVLEYMVSRRGWGFLSVRWDISSHTLVLCIKFREHVYVA